MYWRYLGRELAGRKRQTIVVAVGLAIAVALVVVVNSLSVGVRDAQAQALQSIYGVGTDITVTGAAAQPGQNGTQGQGPGRNQFQFGSGEGQADGNGTTTVNRSRLAVDFGTGTLDAASVATVQGVKGVQNASGALALRNTTFSGQLPTRQNGSTGQGGLGGQAQQTRPTGGPDGAGGSQFDVTSFSVLGIDPANAGTGPLSAVQVTSGRALSTGDAGTDVAILDATYATTANLAVGGTIDVGGTSMQIVGIVGSTSTDAATASNVYIPLDVAQTIAGTGDVVSTVYVQADSADSIGTVQSAIATALPSATVKSESDLAGAVTGSLSGAASLITNLGTWLSIIVIAVAVLLAVLFTLSGVARRTRELGTLKALGWSNGRVVGQVAGESVVQSAIGGAVGLGLGLVAIWVINLIGPTFTSGAAVVNQAAAAGAQRGFGGGFAGRAAQAAGGAAQATTNVVLNAPVSFWLVVIAIGLAVLGGLVAGAIGGWRASRLRPAEALRSVG